MRQVTLAEAESNFTELVAEAERGEVIEIVRNGQVVVKLVSPGSIARKPLDVASLRALTAGVPPQGESAVQKLRDEARY
jgi:prevent-host-death family protein